MSPRVLLGIVVGLLALLAAAPAAHAGGASCANQQLQPQAGNLPQVRAAVLCLHNAVRRAHGLPALRPNRRLRLAADRHSENMVAAGFFAHESPGGADMVDRVLRTGYGRRHQWSIGENIAWGTGPLATPAEIHAAWMASPGHQENILRRQFREIGIGIALGAPVDTRGQDGVTYTADFGARR